MLPEGALQLAYLVRIQNRGSRVLGTFSVVNAPYTFCYRSDNSVEKVDMTYLRGRPYKERVVSSDRWRWPPAKMFIRTIPPLEFLRTLAWQNRHDCATTRITIRGRR